MRTIFDHHMSATVFADHICHFILNINLFKFFLCSIYILLQIRIEVAYYCLPLYSSCCHTVQKPFHSRSEVYIYNTRESLFHNIIDNFPQLCNIQVLLFFCNITAADDRCDRRRIGTWTSDPQFFHSLDQRCLCIMCRRLREMLFWFQFLKTKLHSSFKTLIQNISFFLVLFICVYRHKSVKYDLRGRDCKNILVCTNLYRCCFVFCRSHSAGRKTSPDKLIQSELIS